ncbi:MAG: type II toxin-antitoxin system VapC family toxin [Desertimonas sp.]
MGSGVTLLLDTATLVWAMTAPDRMSAAALQALDAEVTLLVSAASAWEITTKHRQGRLPAVGDLVNGWEQILDRFRFGRLAITERHALRAGGFPVDHADPFDRMIAAQAEIEDLGLVQPRSGLRPLPGPPHLVIAWRRCVSERRRHAGACGQASSRPSATEADHTTS